MARPAIIRHHVVPPSTPDRKAFLVEMRRSLWRLTDELPFYLDHAPRQVMSKMERIIDWLIKYEDDPASRGADAARAKAFMAAHGYRPTFRQMVLFSPHVLARQSAAVKQEAVVQTTFGQSSTMRWVYPGCEATTKAGKPCRRRALFGQTQCAQHGGDRVAANALLEAEAQRQQQRVLDAISDPADKLAVMAVLHDPPRPTRLPGVRLTPRFERSQTS